MPTLQISDEAFKFLWQRVQEGDERAAALLVHTQEHFVRNAVRAHLHPAARRLVDSTDVVQMVWADFFASVTAWINLDDPRQLTALLLRMTRKRTLKVNRDLLDSQKRDLRRQVSLDDVPDPESRVRSPLHAAMIQDDWERFLQDREPHERKFLNLLRDGCTLRDVADLLGVCERSARRLLEGMREILPSIEF